MVFDAALFVSKRLQVASAAMLCLVAAQCTLELVRPVPAAARVAVTR